MILTFHKVAINTPTIWWISNDKFVSILDSLATKKFTYLDDYDQFAEDQVVITFDGPYACILDFAVPELHRRGIPFEVYLIGDYVGRDNSFDSAEPRTNFCSLEELKELRAHGGRLQWHSRTHQIPASPTEEKIDFELEIPSALLDEFPGDFKHFAYPHGRIHSKFKEKVTEKFISAQGTDDGIHGDFFEMPRVTVFPNSKFNSTTVSLLLMNYNYAPYILEAHESVRRQILSPDKYLVVDDSSTDGSQELIKRSIKGAEIILREKNLGIVQNFNSSMASVKTDYAMFLGADNYLHPHAIRELKLALDLNPDIAIAYFDMVLVGPLASDIANKNGAEKIGRSLRDNCDVFLWSFPYFNEDEKIKMENANIINGSAMFRVSAFNDVGGYQNVYPEDHNLWKRMLKYGFGAIRVDKPLLYYRQHSPSQTNTALAKEIELVNLRRQAAEPYNPKIVIKIIIKWFLNHLPTKVKSFLYWFYKKKDRF
jgi:glycosyltransferase involved in cell wall biosynthesis